VFDPCGALRPISLTPQPTIETQNPLHREVISVMAISQNLQDIQIVFRIPKSIHQAS
jgi:hypothetical protein